MIEKKKVKKKIPGPLKGEVALKLARKGPEEWNRWANKKETDGRGVDFQNVDFTAKENQMITFDDFTFPGDVDFFRARFLHASFKKAIFKGKTQFTGTLFKDSAFFQGAVFKGEVEIISASFYGGIGFNNTTFEKDASFIGTTFAGPVALFGSHFKIVPDLRLSEFKKHITLHDLKVEFRHPTKETDADMYRRLKELAVNSGDHEREQRFFAYELIAKRGHETHGLTLIPNYLYEFFGNFGRSLTLPCFWLLSVWFISGILYRWLETADAVNHIWHGLSYSAAQLFSFLGGSRSALSGARKALFGEEALSAWINALAVIEGGFGILFLFLIALALRNRFRI
ncbi:MAG: pentapeptide repeat-containing protein [Rhodospirillales bacterium]|nr:pentapeptide repeat-containing protein [Rhodospirillales bacterium]